jgi:uncharacterized protein
LSAFAGAGFTAFILILFLGIYLSVFGLPGTVLIFIDVLVYIALTGFEWVGFKIIVSLLVFSVTAEAIDFLMGMAGALRPLPSKHMLWASAIGAIGGSLILTPFLWALGAFGGFFLGCFAGMMITESLRQSKLQSPFKASRRAVFAMLGGKLAKGSIALVMIAVSLSHIYS